jgi:hypothetical protein
MHLGEREDLERTTRKESKGYMPRALQPGMDNTNRQQKATKQGSTISSHACTLLLDSVCRKGTVTTSSPSNAMV